MIIELQEILKNLRTITMDLDSSILGLKKFLDAEEFIPENLGEKIKIYLEEIDQKQTEFVAKYKAFNKSEPDTKYFVLENELREAKKVLEENNKYRNAIKFFLELHSKDEKTEQMLQDKKNVINNMMVDSMEIDALQVFSEPYMWLQEAFCEKDDKKKFSFIYKLASCFEEEIVMGIQFGTLALKADTDELDDKEVNGNLEGQAEIGEVYEAMEEDTKEPVGKETRLYNIYK